MQLTYFVHSASRQPRNRLIELDDELQSIVQNGVEVELADPTTKHGSLTLHFRTPAEQEYALKTFKPGETVTLTLPDAPADEPAAAEPEAEPAPAAETPAA